MKCKAALGRLFVLLATFVLMSGSALAAGIKVVPSVERLSPGESFAVDIVAEGIPAEGLGSVQFRLNVEADGSPVAGVADLGQGDSDAVSVATPLLVSAPTASRSGLGSFFLNGQGPSGILVLDNETLSGGSALFTYGHTKDAMRSSGNGAVARFMIKVGEQVESEEVRISLSDVLLLDGGPEYPLGYNLGATLTLRCNATVPDLAGLSRSEAEQALTDAGLVLGSVYEIDNAAGSHPLDEVLEQSVAAGNQALCESGVDVAINTAPGEVTGLAASDKSDDDTGTVELSWTASISADVAGYRVYEGADLLREVPNPQGSGAEIDGLSNGVAHELTVKAFDTHGNESAGAAVTVTPIDDVFPVVTVSGVSEGTFYSDPVTAQATASDTNLDHWSVTLNDEPFDFAVIETDGAYTLVVIAEDVSGNRTEKRVFFTVDQTAPAITVDNLVDDRHYNADLTPQIVIEDANLDDAATTYTLDGQPYQTATLVTEEGPHTLSVSARDMAGNSSALTLDFVIDKTVPVVAIDGVVDGRHYNADLTPTASVTDTWLKSSSITLNGEPFVSGTAVTAEGEYVLVISGEDEAGNSATQTVNFVIDKTAPVLTVEGVTDGTHYNTYLAPATSITDTYLKSGSITLNGEPFVSGTAVTEEGEYVLTLSGEDEAGNTASLAVDFVIDKTPPQILVSGVTDGALYNVDVTPVVAISDEYLKSSTLTLDGLPFVSASVISEEGAYALAAGAEDRAGNRTEVALDFIIDKTAPTSTSSVGAPSFGVGEQLFISADTTVTLSTVDGGAVPTGLERLELALDQTQNWDLYADSFTLAGQVEGDHDIHFRASDKAGNVEEIRTLPVILDKSAPSTAASTQGAKFTDVDGTLYIAGATEFSLSATDNLSGVAQTAYRIDGAGWDDDAAFTMGGLAEGNHSIAYRSIDNVDNAETEQVLAVTVDNTAPLTEISVGGPQYMGDALYVTSATEFTRSAADNLSGVAATEYRIDGGEWAAYAPFTLVGLPDGDHVIGYRSIDNVNNLEIEKLLTVVVDNTAPETAIDVGEPKYTGDALYVTGATELTLSVTDNLSGVVATEYRIDGGSWTAYAPFTLNGLPDGEHTIGYRSCDKVTNLESEKVLRVVVDNTTPETAIDVGEPQYREGSLYVTGATEFTLSAADNLSGVAETEYRIDDGAWTAYAPFTLAGLADGEHTIGYRSRDNVANLETEKVLTVVVDNTAAVSGIDVGEPQYRDGDLYVTGATAFTMNASDNLSGVAATEYRIDGGAWTAYAPFTLTGLPDGGHTIGYRSTDNVGNVETEKVLTVVVDTTAPVTLIDVGEPKYQGGALFVSAETGFTLNATDTLSAVAKTQYRIDDGDWTAYASFSLAGMPEGEHVIEYHSADHVGNVEEVKSLTVVIDNTPPETSIGFQGQSYLDGERLLVSGQTEVSVNATDNLSGVAATYYRFDDETQWRTYHGAYKLADLEYGSHTIHFRSIDNVANDESAKAVEVVLIGIEVDTEVLNLPRVLVWSEDPGTMNGRNKPSYTLDDIRSVVEESLGVPDIYLTMVADKEDFKDGIRSGIYNMAFIVNQDVPFDALFLRELREAVHRGVGLLVSSWGNNVHPLLQDVFGVDFSGSLAMDELQRPLHLYESPVAAEKSLTARGRILKTGLDGGVLAGLVPADSECSGMRGLSLFWPVETALGDRVTASLSITRGSKATLIDEEQALVDSLPGGAVNRSVGNTAGDITIESFDDEGVHFAITAPYGYLEESYLVALSVVHADGSSTTLDPVNVTPTCAANLCSGMSIGPCEVVRVDEDRIKSGEDMPAVVLGQYGQGKTAFFAYNIIESALHGERSSHVALLNRAATYLLPDQAETDPDGVSLLQTTVKVRGAGLDLKASESLDPELIHLPLFDLDRKPLEFPFHVEDEEEHSYRYFVRFADRQGTFGKETAVSLLVDGSYTLFDRIREDFALENDSSTLLFKITSWFEVKKGEYAVWAEQFEEMRQELRAIGSMTLAGDQEKEQAIRRLVQVIRQIDGLPFDTSEVRGHLDDYLRIMESGE